MLRNRAACTAVFLTAWGENNLCIWDEFFFPCCHVRPRREMSGFRGGNLWLLPYFSVCGFMGTLNFSGVMDESLQRWLKWWNVVCFVIDLLIFPALEIHRVPSCIMNSPLDVEYVTPPCVLNLEGNLIRGYLWRWWKIKWTVQSGCEDSCCRLIRGLQTPAGRKWPADSSRAVPLTHASFPPTWAWCWFLLGDLRTCLALHR